MADDGKLIRYKRARFSTHLPSDFLYTPSHAWLQRIDEDVWRVGITKFATRMLGDLVDHKFDIAPDTPVAHGQILGWIEGFKAITDIYCVVEGDFLRSNDVLKSNISVVNKKPYSEGWLYEAKGASDPRFIDVNEYMAFLDIAIDKILEKEQAEIQ
ncbi:MAG: glycine cleavage system protein H [Verrucomicrobiales bacterium]|nr:glycine cleavage system protein H [Verrucomicrobiales bacterium]|tara:strand:+ start:216 stop:683 length:468 start_codon:yes stop_codon:yes gene_type:complete